MLKKKTILKAKRFHLFEKQLDQSGMAESMPVVAIRSACFIHSNRILRTIFSSYERIKSLLKIIFDKFWVNGPMHVTKANFK